MSEHFQTPWHVDPLSATVYASDVPKGPARVADMRGWGYLTGKGHGALALSQDEAIDIQRANAAFIVKAVNSHDVLLCVVRQLIESVDSGNLQMNSPEIGEPENNIPIHQWHEELLHYARTALASIKETV